MFVKRKEATIVYEDGLSIFDYAEVVIYFVLLLTVGFLSLWRENRNTLSGYFLAGRFMVWMPIGASLFMSNIGSDHFIGQTAASSASGMWPIAYELNGLFLLPVLGWLFVPVYYASGVSTVPGYLKRRFGGERLAVYVATMSLLLYVFMKTSVGIYSGALFIQHALNLDLYECAAILLAITTVVTVTGGLAAVIYTDTMQFFILMVGGSILMVKSFIEVDGWEGLLSRYLQALPEDVSFNETCNVPPRDSFLVLRDPSDDLMPWPAFFLGQTIASLWYWCCSQAMVQRVLAGASLSHGQGATLFAAYSKIMTPFLIIIPGMIARVLYKEEIGCHTEESCLAACGNPNSCYNSAYPILILKLMPPGLRGVMMAVMLSALMSDLTTIFSSSSTIFTVDIYNLINRKLRRRCTEQELVIVGKLFIVFMAFISFLCIFILEEVGAHELYSFIQKMMIYLGTPIATVYLVAIIWTRMSEEGAFWSLMLGLLVGVARMTLDFTHMIPSCRHDDTRPKIIRNFHHMYFCLFLFMLCLLVIIIVSLCTDRPHRDLLIRTTIWTKNDETRIHDILSEETVETRDSRHNPAWYAKIFQFICGIPARGTRSTSQEHLQNIVSLRQPRRERIVLNILVIIILCICVFMYSVFSISPYSDTYPYKVSVPYVLPELSI